MQHSRSDQTHQPTSSRPSALQWRLKRSLDPKLIFAIWMHAVVAAPQSTPRTEPPLASQEIVTAIGSEADTRPVVKLVLGDMFVQRYNGLRHHVHESQVREAWLPDRTRIEVGRLPEKLNVQRQLATCGDYWVLFDVTRKERGVDEDRVEMRAQR